MLTSHRRRLAAASLVLLVPLVGACGFNVQTDQVYQPGVGSNVRSGTVDILGAVVVSGSAGSGTFVASLVNKDLDKDATLTSVTAADGTQAQLTAPVKVGADSLVNLASLGAVRVGGDKISAGGWTRLTLTFDTGQKTEVNTPIVARDGEFSSISPALPAPSGSASPSASPTP